MYCLRYFEIHLYIGLGNGSADRWRYIRDGQRNDYDPASHRDLIDSLRFA